MAVDTREAQLLPQVQKFISAPRKMLIGADWTDAASGETFASIDPATGREITQIPLAGPEDVDRAVKAARAAFAQWSETRPVDRADVLFKIADLIDQHREELTQIEALDSGKPIMMAGAEIVLCARVYRYYAGWCDKVYGETNPTGSDLFVYTLREPVGVCAQIVPWNYPLMMATWKVAPALATGCVSVLKPAEETPLSMLRLGELALEAGLPPGALNVITGPGEITGDALVKHPDVDKIAFTGSTEVGKLIMKNAADRLARVSLELGGKSPNVIFADADTAAALPNTMMGIFYNAGQTCTAGSRLLVERSIHDQFVDQLKTFAANMKVGDSLAPDTMMGPLVSRAQFDRVGKYLEIGTQEGAEAVLGGNQMEGDGYFVEPTIFTGVRPDMRIAQEEIFGPVLSVIPFENDEEAVRIANDTIYGLAAAVWTQDVKKAHRMARAIKAGMVWINSYLVNDVHSPHGGFKQSGFGRDLGKYALDLYTEIKTVWVQL